MKCDSRLRCAFKYNFIEVPLLFFSATLCETGYHYNRTKESQINYKNKTLKPIDHVDKFLGWVFSQAVNPQATLIGPGQFAFDLSVTFSLS